MYRVLLLDVGTPRDELSEPIGIETIASYIEAEVPQVQLELKSLELESIKIDKFIQSNSFDIIGISTKIRAFDRLKKLVSLTKRYHPETVIVLGDIVATFAFEEILKLYPDVVCVRGEGEIAMPEIIKSYAKYKRLNHLVLQNICNLAYKYNGDLILTNRSAIDVQKARHPRRYFLDKISQQHGIVHLECSRGCIYSNCSFCGVNEKYNRTFWRPFDINFIIKELEILSEAGFKSPYFTDEDFFGNDVQRVIRIAQNIISAKEKGLMNPNLNFYLNARVGSLLGDEYGGIKKASYVLSLLKKAGLREIFTGVESGGSKQIDRYKKATTVKKNIEAIELLKNLGIDLDTGFIFFDPFATLKDLRENLTFIYKAGLNTNYSRLVKKLRLQPFTGFTDMFLRICPRSTINLNLVCYDYDFENKNVAEIFNLFHSWEIENMDIIYNMQSFARGEVRTEKEREEVKKIISFYRFLDIEYLNALITAFENSYSSLKYLNNITKQFKSIRENFDDEFIDRMRWYDSTYRRYGVSCYEFS